MLVYSISAYSPIELEREDPLILFEPGLNACVVRTDDIDSLVEWLKMKGVRVDEVNQLDGGSQFVEDPST